MSIFTIADLHLALGIDKPMDVFGGRWSNYMEKLKDNWISNVSEKDTVIIPGDVSWATYIDSAYEDFRFIEDLPGKKVISKGNHDYWWTTSSKLNKYLTENNFSTISFMHNNAFELEGVGVCGTRGWKGPGEDDFKKDDEKIYKREIERLELSVKAALKLELSRMLVFMHYPPVTVKSPMTGFIDIMRKYEIKECYYGHLHGEGIKGAIEGEYEGINLKLVSSDYLNFKPFKII
ncbi:metallophosphoesterase [Ruminiclostridium papyrosolvens DSM 2782]|uniref:Metallophosphoesterase n=1 Tax=Ruminiclostridium papyrosolvens DSM 2782 TaxID=588581 RepID=F1TFP3_9FIRM|nr:metallophosphoesterase [Ruminiclostridium papyrosolvens]EGD46775.1 metallophosphoesterase [Ruminiclostridium papyrosolvens DSM 2782]WES34885.1 metallophosphoesterase [Ruminiclostridium papyrosolvens DSM 2782]